MHCETAEELLTHLSRLVGDPVAVAEMVRVRFPEWSPPPSRTNGKAAFKSPRGEPDTFIWDDQYERGAKKGMATGSHALLASLWKNHARILHRLEEQGRRVQRP